ncbi:MAG: sialate O-acetylesterase [Planctomycetaceae bacterium]|nr:sialate O-acetylesterase [Planctomycetaceae bacterium]
MRTTTMRCLVGMCLSLAALPAWANVKLPAVIGSNMVLQQGQPLRIWGWADAGEAVTVTLGDSQVTATPGPNGRWQVELPAIAQPGGPHEMTVKGKNEIKLTNILVGEVWAGSGQSNMQWAVSQSKDAAKEIAEAKYPKIRLFLVQLLPSGTPADDVGLPPNTIYGRWVECSPETVPGSSAVLYFFGREIHKQLDVPVGLITTAWGGTRIQPWIPPEGYAAIPELAEEQRQYRAALQGYVDSMKNFGKAAEAWAAKAQEALAAGQLPSVVPATPAHPLNNNYQWTGLYNGMIHPIVPFSLRGFLWYQGESNNGQGMAYYQLKRGLIQGWRKVWGRTDAEMPFLFAQLAPFDYGGDPTRLPGIWEAQTATLKVPNTGMAVLTDITTLKDIHPPNKQDVGRRLALWALAKTYGKSDLVYSGPLYKSMAADGSKIQIAFDHSAGLKSRDGKPLSWWSIAGADKKFVPAKAEIAGDNVVVSAEGVGQPVHVRFGWHQLAEPNLANGAGLPASPFRTDEWTDAVNAEPAK